MQIVDGMLKSDQTMAILKSKHDTFENNKKRYYSMMHVCKYKCPNITIRNNKLSKKQNMFMLEPQRSIQWENKDKDMSTNGFSYRKKN